MSIGSFELFRQARLKPFEAQKSFRGMPRPPSWVRSDSIEVAVDSDVFWKNQVGLAANPIFRRQLPLVVRTGRPAPSFSARCRRRRLSIQPRIPCQTVFYKTVRTNPPETAEAKTSRPKRPSRESRQSSQERNPKKLFLDLKNSDPNSCEPFTKPSGAAPSKES